MKALVTSEFPEEALKKLEDLLRDEVIYESWRQTKNLYFDEDSLVSRIKETSAEILICEGDNVKAGVIDKVELKIIGATRDDPNNVDIDAATRRGIPVLFAPKRNTIAVAELTVGLMLSLARKLHQIDRVLHGTEFNVDGFEDYVDYYNRFKGIELHGKTVGIVGLGSIGYEVARRLVPFGVKLLVHDPYVTRQRLDAVNATRVPLEVLMKESDFVTLHCPPVDETDGMIGEYELSLLKPTAYFLNLARASITDEDALFRLLKERKIAGAALDVFSIEPVDQDNEFLALDNVIVTPHVGGDTDGTNYRHAMMMVDGINKILSGKVPDNIVNPEVMNPSITREKLAAEKSTRDLRAEIVDTCRKLLGTGYIVGTAGNVSARVRRPGREDLFLITPSSVDYLKMTPEDIVLLDDQGNVLAGSRNPSSEFRMHLAIYRARPDVGAVIHSHAPYSTTLSIARLPIGPIVDEFIPFVGGCEVARFAPAGTEMLAMNVVEALGQNMAVLVSNHGNVCCGDDLDHAWNICRLVEQTAMVQYQAYQFDTLHAIPEETEEEEKEIYDIIRQSGD